LLLAWLEKQEGKSGGALRIAFIAWVLSTFVASPAFFTWTWEGIAVHSRAADYLRLCEDPLARDLNELIVAYRLAVPLLAWVLHLPPVAALLLPYFFHFGFLMLVFLAMRQRTDARVAILTSFQVALSFALFWSNWKPGFTDTVSHGLIAAMLIVPSPLLAFGATALGLLNDERTIMALPLVFLWHFGAPKLQSEWWRRVFPWSAAVLAGVAGYWCLRHALTVGWIGPGIVRPPIYDAVAGEAFRFKPWLGSWTVALFNVLLAYRWTWLLIAAGLVVLWRLGRRLEALLLGSVMAVGALASVAVADVARSMGFLFPAVLSAAAALVLFRAESAGRWLSWTLAALLVSPVFYTAEQFAIAWFRPLPLVLVRMATGWDIIR